MTLSSFFWLSLGAALGGLGMWRVMRQRVRDGWTVAERYAKDASYWRDRATSPHPLRHPVRWMGPAEFSVLVGPIQEGE